VYGKVSWYIGVFGFFVFFIFKYREARARAKVIKATDLKDKLASSEKLLPEDYTLLSSIVCSQDNAKERANFFVIFALSAVALAYALIVEFRV